MGGKGVWGVETWEEIGQLMASMRLVCREAHNRSQRPSPKKGIISLENVLSLAELLHCTHKTVSIFVPLVKNKPHVGEKIQLFLGLSAP